MNPVAVIAEVGLAHEGSLALAHSYIDACVRHGADVVKFQLHLPDEGTAAEPFRTRWSIQDGTRPDYWRRTGFHVAEWKALHQHVVDTGRQFMLSAFCEEGVAWGYAAGCKLWKVPSGQVNNIGLITSIAKLLPERVYLSTGLASVRELGQALHVFEAHSVPVTLLHCVTAYPTPANRWALSSISYLAHHYTVPVGLSDHSGGVTAGLAAVAGYGAVAVEVHVTFDKSIKLADTKASLTFPELDLLAHGVRAIEVSRQPQSRDMSEFETMRKTYMPSLVARNPIPAGTVLDLTHLMHKKVGRGPSLNWEDVVGKVLARAVEADHVFVAEDFVGATCAASA